MITLPRLLKPLALALLSAMTIVVTGCGAHLTPTATEALPGSEITVTGKAEGGQQPVSGASIQLYAVGTTGDKTPSTALIPIATPVLTDAGGGFTITSLYNCTGSGTPPFAGPTSDVYLILTGGDPGLGPGKTNPNLVLMSALGPCGNLTANTFILINEVSTVGSIFPITPFMANYLNVGSANSDALTLANDFVQVNEYINTSGGQSPGPTLPANFTAPVATLNSLANAMSACVNSSGGVAGDGSVCGNLFLYATPTSGTAPTNTADAILDIANNPTQNVANIFALAVPSSPFAPSLSSAPSTWALPILPDILLTSSSTLVGAGSPGSGTITLAQAAPAGGLSVALASSNTAYLSVTSPVNFAAGATTATFNYAGVAPGAATITGTAAGYAPGTITLTSTNSLISLGTIPTVAPGQSVSLPLSLGTPAPAGGVSINFASVDPTIATITPSVVNIAAGLQVPTTNPQVTGVKVGGTTINANATGYAPGARAVTVSVTASLPTTYTIPIGTQTNEVLTISAPAPAGGITFNLSVDTPADISVVTPVTVPAGQTTVNLQLTGNIGGTTTNVRADSTGIAEAVSAVTVNGMINLGSSSMVTGKLMETSNYFQLAATPSGPTTVTLTSANPAVALVSTSATTLGANTGVASIANVINTNGMTFYVQGVSVGSTNITISATGYNNTVLPITVNPSGFTIGTPYGQTFSTTTFSTPSTIYFYPVILNSSATTVLANSQLSPAASGLSIATTDSATGVGTVPANVTFNGGDTSESFNFTPVVTGTGGTVTLGLTTPTGFTTPTPASNQTVTGTVTAPPITIGSNLVTTGVGMQVNTYGQLSATPQGPETMTFTVADPTVALASASLSAIGAGVTGIPNITGAGGNTIYIQGLKLGSTTVTVSAPGYTSATFNVTVDPSGFAINSPYGASFSTTTFSGPSSIYVSPVILSPTNSQSLGGATLNPGTGTVVIPINDSSTATGTISPASVNFNTASGTSQTIQYQPANAGSSTITLTQPSGFTSVVNQTQVVATVSAPLINVGSTNVTTGLNLEVSTYGQLGAVPPTAVNMTFIVADPTVAVISESNLTAGAAQNNFANVVNQSGQTIYIQGLKVGTTTIAVSAPGYQPATINVTVNPSGFTITSPYGSAYTTTSFSGQASLYVSPVILNPTTLTVYGGAALTPGNGSVTLLLTDSLPAVGTVSPASVTFNGGDTSQTTYFQPAAAGTAVIGIPTPAGYSTPTPATTQSVTFTVTAPAINVGSTATTTGVNLEVSNYGQLGQVPPSAVVLTATVADPTVATIATSATTVGVTTIAFPATTSQSGMTIYIQGHRVGTTTITWSAPGFSNATTTITCDLSGFTLSSPYGAAFSTTTFSGQTSIYASAEILDPNSLAVVASASVSPGIGSPSIAVTIPSASASVGTVTSPFVFTAGTSTQTQYFTPAGAAGTAAMTLGTAPTGFSTPSQAASQTVTATVTAPNINSGSSTITSGVHLQTSSYLQFGTAPPTATSLQLVSNNTAVAIISTSPTVAGTGVINFPASTSQGGMTFYVQGVSAGTTTLTATATGFNPLTINVTVGLSGFTVNSPYGASFTTTTFSAATSVYVSAAILDAKLLTVIANSTIAPGGATAVTLTSGTPGVGSVTASVNFNPGDTTQTASFTPLSAGSTAITINTPTGYTLTSQTATQTVTATVSAPGINVSTTNAVTGANLQVANYAQLAQAPPAAVVLTVTSNNPAVATVSVNSSTVGTASINFPAVSTTNVNYFTIQGAPSTSTTSSSTTLTISAPGFASTTINVTVDPSGFVITGPSGQSLTTTHGGAASTITVTPEILNSGVLTSYAAGTLNPGIGPISVPLSSTSPQFGTISPTSAVFNGGDSSHTTAFTPLATGSTDVIIVNQPTGFTQNSQASTQQVVITVQ